MLGPATTVTADVRRIPAHKGRAKVATSTLAGDGCGIVPLLYKDKAAVTALQWAIGLEIFLLSADPWRVVLSPDHPNGGSFLSYPRLIQLLMDRGARDQTLKQVNPKLLAGSTLADGLAREYTLNESHRHPGGSGQVARPSAQGHRSERRGVTVYVRKPDIAASSPHHGTCQRRSRLMVEEVSSARGGGRRLHVSTVWTTRAIDLRRHFDAMPRLRSRTTFRDLR